MVSNAPSASASSAQPVSGLTSAPVTERIDEDDGDELGDVGVGDTDEGGGVDDEGAAVPVMTIVYAFNVGSSTLTVIRYVPARVGVPLITPSERRRRPGGRAALPAASENA